MPSFSLPCSLSTFILAGALLAAGNAGSARAGILLPDLPCGELQEEAVLFGFDSSAFPFQIGLETHLIPGKYDSMAVPHGPDGSVDELIRFYGTIVRIDGHFRMWYWGSDGPEDPGNGFGNGGRESRGMLYATSDDGIHWKKPDLGLVNFKGSTHNNLVAFDEPKPVVSAAIMYDPEDADASRRFKLVFEAARGGPKAKPCVAFSPDGLHWHAQPDPIGEFLEMGGVMKFRGKYYAIGQSPSTVPGGRKILTLVSADFVHWSPCGAIGLSRGDIDHDEVHLGAGVWNRGDVVLGVYGQWHGTANGDRRLLTMDLGFAITHDGLHYEEPVRSFKFIPSREQPGSPPFDMPALMQGQGMINVGNKTFFWYSLWRTWGGTGVRLATWDRDRFGMLKPYYVSGRAVPSSLYLPQAISCAFQSTGATKTRVFANVGGLGANTTMRVNLLGPSFQPIPGYTAVLTKSGLRLPVEWENHQAIGADLGETHVQVKFEGVRPEDGNLYAVYLAPEGS